MWRLVIMTLIDGSGGSIGSIGSRMVNYDALLLRILASGNSVTFTTICQPVKCMGGNSADLDRVPLNMARFENCSVGLPADKKAEM